MAQERAMTMFDGGLNVAVLGRAGSGKSVLLREMMRRAVSRWGRGAVAITALSGTAAVGVGGQTIHSLFGWDVRPLNKNDWLEHARGKAMLCDKLNRVRVLFVDEAPTMAASLFTRMAHVMRHVAPAHLQGRAFGGCQIVCAGDVLQGAPVKVTDVSIDTWVFSCAAWRSAFHGHFGRVACVTGGHRQPDHAFLALLDRLRWGCHTVADVATVNATWESLSPPPGVAQDDIPKLRIRKAAVHDINRDRLHAIDEPLFKFPSEAVMVATDPAEQARALADLHEFLDPTFLAKVSSPVIFTRRVGRFPTGTRGHIVGFGSRAGESGGGQSMALIVCMVEGERVEVERQRFSVYDAAGSELVFCYQMPLLLGWALTVHRAQGFNLDAVEVDFMQDTWSTCGLVYTALSRCRTLAGLRVKGLTKALVQVSSTARKYMAKEMHAADVLDGNATVWLPREA